MTQNVRWIASLALAAAACGAQADGAKAGPVRKAPPVAPVVELRSPRELSFLGTVFAPRDAVLSSARGGRVEAHLVEIGDRVREGQVVTRLGQGELAFASQVAAAGAMQAAARVGASSSPDRAPAALAARASLDAAEDATRRAEKLHAQGSLSEQELLRVRTSEAVARADHQVALAAAQADLGRLREMRAAVGQANAALSDKEIRAPFDGVVLERRVGVGHVVAANEALLRVVDPSERHVRFEVPQASADAVAIGGKVRLVVGDARVEGQVVRRSPGLVGEASALLVHARLSDPPDSLLVGTRLPVWLALGGEDERLVKVPLSATTSYAGVFRVWVVQDGRLAERLLSVARFEGDHLLARSGLRPGDALVTTPEPGFRAGEQVAP